MYKLIGLIFVVIWWSRRNETRVKWAPKAYICSGDSYEINDMVSTVEEDWRVQVLEHINVLLAEHKIEEAIGAIDAEENSHPELKGSAAESSFKSVLLKAK